MIASWVKEPAISLTTWVLPLGLTLLNGNVDSDIQAPGCFGMQINVVVYKHRHRQTDTYMQLNK